MSIHLAYCTNLPNSSGALYHHKLHWKLPQTFLSTIFPFFHKYMIFPKLNNNSHHKTSSIPILPNIFFSCLHCLLLENNLHFRCNLPITHSLLTFDPLAFDLWSYFQTKRASLSWTFLYFLQHWSSLLKGLMLSFTIYSFSSLQKWAAPSLVPFIFDGFWPPVALMKRVRSEDRQNGRFSWQKICWFFIFT